MNIYKLIAGFDPENVQFTSVVIANSEEEARELTSYDYVIVIEKIGIADEKFVEPEAIAEESW